MTVHELLTIMGGFHNDGHTGKQVRVFVTDETIERATNSSGVEIKKVYLDEEAYPHPEIVIEV